MPQRQTRLPPSPTAPTTSKRARLDVPGERDDGVIAVDFEELYDVVEFKKDDKKMLLVLFPTMPSYKPLVRVTDAVGRAQGGISAG